MEDIEQLRARIDDVDRLIVEKLNERCTLVRQIGQWKKEHSLPIYVPARERQLLEKLTALNSGPLENSSLVAIYREIMSAALKLEQPLKIGTLLPSSNFPLQGVFEKFGHGVTKLDYENMRELCQDVLKKTLDYAVIPIESSVSGIEGEVLDELCESEVKIVTEFTISSDEGLSRFLILGLQSAHSTGNDKTSIFFTLPDQVGSLHSVLLPLCERHLSVSMMEVRPLHKNSFEYRFFVDILGHIEDKVVSDAVEVLKERCAKFKILGSFPRV